MNSTNQKTMILPLRNSNGCVIDAQDRCVCTVDQTPSRPSAQEAYDAAAMIVRAVNAHDDVVRFLEVIANGGQWESVGRKEAARALLARIKGEA